MSRNLKITLLIVAFVIVLFGVLAWVGLRIIGGAFGTKCDVVQTYELDSFRIEKESCLGWAGPAVVNYNLYLNDVMQAGISHKIGDHLTRHEFPNHIRLETHSDGSIRYVRQETMPDQSSISDPITLNTDSIIEAYLLHYREKQEVPADESLSFMTSNEVRDGKAYLMVDIGHHLPDRWEHDDWIFIDPSTGDLFEYDVVEDLLIPVGKIQK